MQQEAVCDPQSIKYLLLAFTENVHIDYKIGKGRNFYQLCSSVSPVPTTIGALPHTVGVQQAFDE